MPLRCLLLVSAALLPCAWSFSPSGLAAFPRSQTSCKSAVMSRPQRLTGLRMAEDVSETQKLSRRQLMGFVGAAGLLAPFAANAETAEMGLDVLDRPEFRRRQDLVKFNSEDVADLNLSDIPFSINGKKKKVSKLLGKTATVVMNIKLDDPESTVQLPALRSLITQYADQGLGAILVPTDQGDYEPDDSATVRIKVASQYNIQSSTKGPVVVTDKTDIVGKFAHPLYKYLTYLQPNPNNVSRITLNYEKFLLDANGKVLRRYPRLWPADRMARDVAAVLAGQPLPAEDPRWLFAWKEADKEVTRSIYSFRKHYNYYDQQEAGQDWAGTKSEAFTPGSNEARFKGVTTGKPLEVPLGN
eukprot:CAMPEP_0177709912 /NCGR_PEP_ID=MMETSP0484_2-20121128/11054_1 /TAXON_ID=354590 /ORGANISM="Rhodomonas lens, Strain RHODO" /LENGTH=356 /DNA_ID=CAMNT_0019221557 /DNA_START=42 /DNA_END=1112 /DNA_ORIENTATION=+